MSIHFYIMYIIYTFLYYIILFFYIIFIWLTPVESVGQKIDTFSQSAVAVDQSPCLVIRKSLVQFPGLHVEVSLFYETVPLNAPDVQVDTVHGSRRHQCVNVCKSLWQKIKPDKLPKIVMRLSLN